ncbi:hypothetical protein SynA15127_01418 [Synechococcus sp. A15-127]|nr:hypothetical protein SynA15127_01418 [Synechococcus sp. A15-127]
MDVVLQDHNQSFLRKTVVDEDWQVAAGEIMQNQLLISTRQSHVRPEPGLAAGLCQECCDGIALALH